MKEKIIEKVLINLDDLLKTWGIDPSDWILVANYAYRLLGYDVKLRPGHFNVIVVRDKIPWKIKEGIEIHPPRNTEYRSDFQKFIEKTGFDFDINLATEEEFRQKKGKYVLYTLSNGRVIRVQTPLGALKEFEKLLALSTKEGLGVERIDKDISYIKDLIKALLKRKEEVTAELFRKLLQKYYSTKKQTKKQILSKTEISGIVASGGRTRGEVIVVRNFGDTHKTLTGNILVTQMTTPTLVAVLPKIAAVVTDWGGKLSHAAILAREMGVPCIVGTQNATKVLKDGDLVEVDAEKGVVRKLDNEKD